MSSSLVGIALHVVMALEQITGMPIAVMERTDHPFEFRSNAATSLCEKTGDNFCAHDLDFIEPTTAAEGFAMPMQYLGDDGTDKVVCLMLPPSPRFTPADAAIQISGGQMFNFADVPAQGELEAWLIMHWGARCLDQEGSRAEEQRADAFASMSLSLMQGDPAFTRYPLDTPARKFAFFRNRGTTEAAVDLAERHMLNIWKPEAAQAVQAEGCQAQATNSNQQQVSRIPRESVLPNCFQQESGPGGGPMFPGFPGFPGFEPRIVSAGVVPVTDANLHLWMYGESSNQIFQKEREHGQANPVAGAPPRPWSAFKGFPSTQAAVTYVWQSASQISGIPY